MNFANHTAKWLQASILGVPLYLAASMLGSTFFYSYDFSNTTLHAFLWPSASTQWAEGFTDAKIDKITAGMSEAHVLEVVGDPLARFNDPINGESSWLYSWSGAVPCCGSYEGNFHRREVVITQGRVKSVRREFDVD